MDINCNNVINIMLKGLLMGLRKTTLSNEDHKSSENVISRMRFIRPELWDLLFPDAASSPGDPEP